MSCLKISLKALTPFIAVANLWSLNSLPGSFHQSNIEPSNLSARLAEVSSGETEPAVQGSSRVSLK